MNQPSSGSALFAEGDLILGQYRVNAVKSGGMGIVYLCSGNPGGEVAIKSIQKDPILDPRARELFKNEAQAWLTLEQHPNIVSCISVFENPYDKRLMLLLELVRGHPEAGSNLAEWLRKSAISRERIRLIATGIAEGMRHVYETRRLIHRDLKPANVMMTAEGVAKVTDFGIAKRQVVEGAAANNTGQIMGTPEYMAPEVWKGAERASVRSDIYAYGLILWEMLAGRHPFEDHFGSYLSVQYAHYEVAPHDPRAINPAAPEDLAALALACLEKDPLRRPKDFSQVLARLGPASVSGATRDAKSERGVGHWFGKAKGMLNQGLAQFRPASAPAAPRRAEGAAGTDHWFNRAQGLLKLGLYDEAEALLTKALRDDPKDLAVNIFRLHLFSLTGRLSEAADSAALVAAIPAREPAEMLMKYDALKLQGRIEEGLPILDAILKAHPGHRMALHAKATALAYMGRFEEALAAYDRAAEAGGFQSLCDKGVLLQRLGRQQEAQACFHEALKRNPNDGATLVNIGRGLRRQGDARGALTCAERAIQTDPQSTKPLTLKAEILSDAGNTSGAEACHRKALNLAPTKVETLGNFAAFLFSHGRKNDADEIVRKAIQSKPRDCEDFMVRGFLAQAMRFPQDARDAFKNATRLQPGNSQAWSCFGEALFESGGVLPDAMQACQRALELAPGDVSAKKTFGGVSGYAEAYKLFSNKNNEKARPALENALLDMPGSRRVRELLFYTLMSLKLYGAALPVVNWLLANSPDAGTEKLAIYLHDKSVCLFHHNMFKEAEEVARKAMTLTPQAEAPGKLLAQIQNYESQLRTALSKTDPPGRMPTALYWYALGVKEREAGKFEVAEENFRRGVNMDPGHRPSAIELSVCLLMLANTRRNAFHQMLEVLAPFAAAYPDDEIVQFNFVQALKGTGKTQAALEVALRLQKKTPDDLDLKATIKSLTES